MSTSDQLDRMLSPAHRNQQLFSDHYLEQMLPADPRWEEGLPEAEAFLLWLQARYARDREDLPQYHERALEGHWFRPILRELGHVFEPEPALEELDEYAKRPDYVFFANPEARRRASQAEDGGGSAAEALAVGEVRPWGGRLDKKPRGGGPDFGDRNPSWQIDYYVRHTGVNWGILSNGRLWRLVHRETSHRLQVYYEVDLVQLLEQADPGGLRYFTLFFRQSAFRPDGRGRVFLDDALTVSKAYAAELRDEFGESAYSALERIVQGFLDRPANRLRPADLPEIYENSLCLLYRLLFILAGESRGLLPVDYGQYRDSHSLTGIRQEISELEVPPASGTTLYWGRLRNLFQVINGTYGKLNRALGVPRYRGALFDPLSYPFLREKEVGDRALVEALERLSRRQTPQGAEFVDYGTLEVGDLCSAAEQLLTYEPRYAEEPMVAVGGNGEGRWLRASEVPEEAPVVEAREKGQVYLTTEDGLRQSTQASSPPPEAVPYVVEQTLLPLVEEAQERVERRLEQAARLGAVERRAQRGQLLADEILTLKVLDPAMGSGSLLVPCTEYLALQLTTDPFVAAEAAPEDDLTHWQRQVVERCIYGVEARPLAVELAKMNLWLATLAPGRPLSFLDHHLKCGDGLIGARVADLGWAPPLVLTKRAQEQVEQQKAGQINMFEHVLRQMLPTVMGRILEIAEQESSDDDILRAKEAAEEEVRKLKEPFQAVADLWISAYFGNPVSPGDYDEALGAVGRPDTLLSLEAVRRARRIAEERHVFHWELAFPEMFFDDAGQRLGESAGFDGVVAVVAEGLKKEPPASHEAVLWSRVGDAGGDAIRPFARLVLALLRPDGRAGLATGETWRVQSPNELVRDLGLEGRGVTEVGVSPVEDADGDAVNAVAVLLKREAELDQGGDWPIPLRDLASGEMLGVMGAEEDA